MSRLNGLRALFAFLLLASPGVRAAESELASIARGGRLYEDWGKELSIAGPRTYERGAERGKERPGRCVDCHGWDYRGKDGRAAAPGMAGGIEQQRGAGAETIKAVLRDSRHGYGDFLKQADVEDLANFLARGQVDMDAAVDPATSRARGDGRRGDVVLQTICANCHGNDGQQIAEAPPLGDTARANPWRALHTLLNGHPNGNMPSLRVMGAPFVQDVLAAAQSLPSRNMLASIVRGGRLYDAWYKENRVDAPKTAHPAWAGQPLGETDPRTTWRCRECHGWDYRGTKSAIDGRERAIRGVDGLMGGDPARAVLALRGDLHDIKGRLSERDIADLANFLTRGQVDMDRYIDRATKKARSASAGYEAHYQTICAPCHGADGREIRTMQPLGRIAGQDPWRALHGIVNGHPGEAMPALAAFPQEMAGGILAYAQTLPQQR